MSRDFRRAFPKTEKDETRDDEQPEFLTVKEVAKLLRCSEGHIYNLVRKVRIPCSLPSGKILFERNEILRWLKDE